MKKLLFLLTLAPILLSMKGATPAKTSFDEDARLSTAHNIVANLAKGDFQAVKANFDPSLDSALSPEKLADGWKSLTGQIGDYKSTLSTSTSVVQSYNQVKVRCKFEKGEATVEVTFSGSDKVIGLYLRP